MSSILFTALVVTVLFLAFVFIIVVSLPEGSTTAQPSETKDRELTAHESEASGFIAVRNRVDLSDTGGDKRSA